MIKTSLLKSGKVFATALALGGALVLFQNCSGSQSEFENVLQSQAADFFAYPYTTAPTYYADIAVYKPATSTGVTLTSFDVLASMTKVGDATAAIPYVFSIYGSDGVTVICPQNTGTLTPPVTTLTFSCVSAIAETSINIKLVLGSGATAQTFTRSF